MYPDDLNLRVGESSCTLTLGFLPSDFLISYANAILLKCEFQSNPEAEPSQITNYRLAIVCKKTGKFYIAWMELMQ